jgi:hypothetical protein
VLVLSIPRRLLWAFPDDKHSSSSIDTVASGSYRIVSSQLLESCNGSCILPVSHGLKRVYQLKSHNHNDDHYSPSGHDSNSNSNGSHVRTLQESDSDSNRSSSNTVNRISVEEISSSVLFYDRMKVIRMEGPAKKLTSTLLLYHYTNPQFGKSILRTGLRMSTQGQGDGGVYFSLKGPASYGYGLDHIIPDDDGVDAGADGDGDNLMMMNSRQLINNGGADYESRLIIDCYGKERLQEYHGKNVLSLVLVCRIEESMVIQAPGGRDNALVKRRNKIIIIIIITRFSSPSRTHPTHTHSHFHFFFVKLSTNNSMR